MMIKTVGSMAIRSGTPSVPVKCKYCGKCLDKGRKSIERCNKCIKRKG